MHYAIEHAHAVQPGFYTHEGRVIWEIEVDHNLRELVVIASNGTTEKQQEEQHEAYYEDYRPGEQHPRVFLKAPGIRIRDMYCGEWAMAEQEAVELTASEARRLACALLAAAEEYDRCLEPVAPPHDVDEGRTDPFDINELRR